MNYDSGRPIGVDLLDAYHVQLKLVYCELVAMDVLGGLSSASVDRVQKACSSQHSYAPLHIHFARNSNKHPGSKSHDRIVHYMRHVT